MNIKFGSCSWALARGRSLALGPVGRLMGIINVTPDSFSDGGAFFDAQAALQQAENLLNDGADILDIGAESTKPGALPIDQAEEQARLLPVLRGVISRHLNALISVDTYRATTAQVALENGAHIINDVWGLQREPDIARVAAEHRAGLVIMHTNRERVALSDVIEDQLTFFSKSLDIAFKVGIDETQIVLDPGFGFGKETPFLNFELMRRFEELHQLGFPFLVGTSRKRFLGAITGRDAGDRDVATAATTALLRQKGAALFRVHDVAKNRDAIKVCDAMVGGEAEGLNTEHRK